MRETPSSPFRSTCVVLAAALTAVAAPVGATSLVAADVVSRHDVGAHTRAEIEGDAVDEADRDLAPVGGTVFSQRSSSGPRRDSASASVTSFVSDNLFETQITVSQRALSQVIENEGLAGAGSSLGQTQSVVEWVVPTLAPEELILWKHRASESTELGQAGSATAETSYAVENVTRSTTLRSGGPGPLTVETLAASPGDVVRLSFVGDSATSANPGDGRVTASASASSSFRVVDATQQVATDVFGPIRAAVVEGGSSDIDALPANSPAPEGPLSLSAEVGASRADVGFEFESGSDEATLDLDVDLLLSPQAAGDASLGDYLATIVPVNEAVLHAALRLDVATAAGTVAQISLEVVDVDTGETRLTLDLSTDPAAGPSSVVLSGDAVAALERGHLYQIRGAAALIAETGAGAGSAARSAIGGISISIVPEPGSGVLTAIGLLGVAWVRRARTTR